MFKNNRNSQDRVAAVAVTIVVLSVVLLSLLSGLLMRTMALYGLGLFVGVPVLIGFLPAAALRLTGPQTFLRCLLIALTTALMLVIELFLRAWEGAICIAMALPLAFPLLVLGAALAYALFHKGSLRPTGPGVAGLVAVVGLSVSDASLQRAPSYVTADSVTIDATRQRVWNEIVNLKTVPAPSGLLLKTGIACPQSVRIPRPGQGGTRLCTLSTGQILERIDVWEPGRRLRWTALSTPPPMTEVNPFGPVDAPHLHGFFEAFRGEFVLETEESGATRLTRRTWYRHNLQPAAYWKFWCDLAAREAHDLVLQEIRRLAERAPGQP
jgi:hypothetical protein